MLQELLNFLCLSKHSIQAVFFDFDGVLVDSVELKSNAYATLFRPYGEEAVSIIKAHHKKHGGIDRYKKIRYVSDTLQLALSENDANALAEEFARLVKESIIKMPIVSGAIELLEELQANDVKSFIVSGTPQNELREIVEAKKLGNYFQGVFGSPMNKKEILQTILSKDNFDNPKKCIFVGDAVGDFEAAQAVGMYFIGVPTLS